MSKSTIGVLIGVICVGIVFYVYSSFLDSEKTLETQPEELASEETTPMEENAGVDVEKQEDNRKSESVPKSKVEREFPLSMDEERVKNAIHNMSHAKVHAEQKWGHLEPTKERIDRLLEVVVENRSTYDHSKLYIAILEKWQAGDFSDSVTAHNSIWDLKNGNVGKATRLLTAAEEAEYREKYFE